MLLIVEAFRLIQKIMFDYHYESNDLIKKWSFAYLW